MPNYCDNDLYIYGNDGGKVLEFIKSNKSPFDFNKIIPMPDGYDTPEGYNKFGYDWCIKNWGTKWNTSNVEITRSPKKISITFSTAWSPPDPIIAKLASLFSECDFIHDYFEMGMGFSGQNSYVSGVLVGELFNDNYSGSRGG